MAGELAHMCVYIYIYIYIFYIYIYIYIYYIYIYPRDPRVSDGEYMGWGGVGIIPNVSLTPPLDLLWHLMLRHLIFDKKTSLKL